MPGDGEGSGPLREHGCFPLRRDGVDVWEKSTNLALIISHISVDREKEPMK